MEVVYGNLSPMSIPLPVREDGTLMSNAELAQHLTAYTPITEYERQTEKIPTEEELLPLIGYKTSVSIEPEQQAEGAGAGDLDLDRGSADRGPGLAVRRRAGLRAGRGEWLSPPAPGLYEGEAGLHGASLRTHTVGQAQGHDRQ